MEQNNLNNNNSQNHSYFQKFKNGIYSFLFDLPFENYHTLYKTGKIKSMDIEQRKQLIYIENNAKLKKVFFSRIISLRPTILDDEDFIEFNNLNTRAKYERAFIILGFFALNSWTFYMVSIKKKNFLSKFLFMNVFLIGMLYYSGHKLQKFFDRMYIKYDKEIVNHEMEEKMNLILKKE